MRVVLAKKIGFCFGVKRAVRMAEAELDKRSPIYSLGSLIHNKEVVQRLRRRGLKVISGVDKIKKGVVVISSHGISPGIAVAIRRRGLKVVDTTCPFVRKAQKIAGRLRDEGYKMIIVGDADHPEVRALIDFAPGAMVVKDGSQVKRLRIGKRDKVSVISQTTQSTANFLGTVKAIAAKHPCSLRVVNTICGDAGDRQEAAKLLAGDVDVMLIVGGKNSANTRRLYEVSRRICRNSYHIEDASGIQDAWFVGKKLIGITSGASTPDCIIEKVVSVIESKTSRQITQITK